MKKILTYCFAAALIFTLSKNAQASLVSSLIELSSPTIIDFSEFNGPFVFTAGPVQIGNPVSEDITWSSTNSGSVIGSGGYGLASNGSWNSGRGGYTGLNTNFGTMRFDFNDALVKAVGGFVNYAPGNGIPSLAAYGDGNTLLETYTLPDIAIATNGSNQGQFFAVSRAAEDIRSFRLSNAFWVLDDLAYSRVSGPSGDPLPDPNADPIPEPSTFFLFGAGIVGVYIRKKRS